MSFKPLIKAIIARCRASAERLVVGTPRLASAYYCLFSTQFDLEHAAVLAGKNVTGAARDLKDAYALRRSIHRLEKGLVMRPRRPVFGEAYILKTVASFVRLQDSPVTSQAERDWFRHVLNRYFEVVEPTPVVFEAKRQFGAVIDPPAGERRSMPFPASDLGPVQVTYEQIDGLASRRKSVRWYEDRPVSLNDIAAAINTACTAPSACNRQPFSFHVSANREVAVALAKCAGGTSGFADNLQCVIAVTGDLAAYVHEKDRHIIYIDASLATMQLLLALEALGLSSCAINWPDVAQHERKIRRILDIEAHERVIMLVAVGYADPGGQIPYSQKRRADVAMKLVM